MLHFLRRKPQLSMRVIKLYSVWPIDEPKVLDRPALVEGLLSTCEQFFGSMPETFDMHGPYGISKGKSVGLAAFRNKLAKRGHDAYYALNGECESSFGFSCLLRAKTDARHLYDELLVWFTTERHAVQILDLAERLVRLFPTDYGFVADFPSDYDLSMEGRRNKTLSGYTLSEDPEHSRWRGAIATVLEGKIRKLYRYNFLNPRQVEALLSLGFPRPIEFVSGVSALVLADDAVFEACKRRYSSVVPAA
jgi:hypothetical protein